MYKYTCCHDPRPIILFINSNTLFCTFPKINDAINIPKGKRANIHPTVSRPISLSEAKTGKKGTIIDDPKQHKRLAAFNNKYIPIIKIVNKKFLCIFFIYSAEILISC